VNAHTETGHTGASNQQINNIPDAKSTMVAASTNFIQQS